jgi:hypothetical protein
MNDYLKYGLIGVAFLLYLPLSWKLVVYFNYQPGVGAAAGLSPFILAVLIYGLYRQWNTTFDSLAEKEYQKLMKEKPIDAKVVNSPQKPKALLK